MYYKDNVLPLLLLLVLSNDDDGVVDVDVDDDVDCVGSGLSVLTGSVALTLSTKTL